MGTAAAQQTQKKITHRLIHSRNINQNIHIDINVNKFHNSTR